MRFASTALVSSFLFCGFGCYTQTDITRTVTMPDGKVETYVNKSNGYNYNPNFTGTNEQSIHVRDYGYGSAYGGYGGMGYGGMGMGGVGMGMPYGGYGAVPVVPVVVPNYGQYGYPY